jgi:predicted outer membrane repeat protein
MYPELKVIDSVITKNVAVEGNEYYYSYSGGIWNWGTCNVVRSIISSNQARFGGGIENYGDLIVDTSSIQGNLANQDGGGIANWGRGTLNCIMKNSNIAKNTAKRYGGGIYNDGVLSLQNSIILKNSATKGGGIASTSGHKPVVSGTIILYNEPNNTAVA